MGSSSGLEEDQPWLPIQNDGVRHAATSISSPPFQQQGHPASTVRLPNEELATFPHLTPELSPTKLTRDVETAIGSAMDLQRSLSTDGLGISNDGIRNSREGDEES
jgi:hypothetical protein